MCIDSSDYSGGVFLLTFESGQDRACQDVGITDDGLLETEEEFEVVLSAEDEPLAVVDPDRGVVRIQDNDGMYG